MSWRLVSSSVKTITEKLAKEFAEMEPAPQDRALSERRLAVYEKAIRNGQWRPCIWAKAECAETGGTYRLNGKHTSTLFVGLAKEFPDHHAVIESYECDVLEDIGRLYGSFDAAICSRTASDINRAFAATVPELQELPRKIIDGCASGIAMYKSGGTSKGPMFATPSDRAENLLEFPEFVLWVSEIVGDTNKYRYLCRQGVVAAMFGSWQKAKKDAEIFWTLVHSEEGDKPSCPDRMLAKWLTTISVTTQANAISSRKADSREVYVRCIHCWNAWRRKEQIKLIKYQASGKVPAFS